VTSNSVIFPQKVYSHSSSTFATDDKKHDEKEASKVDFKILFTNRRALSQTAVSFHQWFTISLVYYGISLNTDALGGDPYLNFLYATLMELAGGVASQLALDKFGRKIPYLTNFVLLAISLTTIAFVPVKTAEMGNCYLKKNQLPTTLPIATK
jgi:hypothetical protein